MSLPAIPRSQGLPSLPSIQPVENMNPPVNTTVRSSPEVLVITVDDDDYDPEGLTVTFEAAGFDVSDDGIILDILRMAAYSYGYDIVPQK